jgi:hypothetical protein
MGARYYQPELGRWTQPDPSGQDANAYAYVGANPVNFVDPSGLNPFGDLFDAIGIAKALEDLFDSDRSARDLLDDLAGTAIGVIIATACGFVAGATGVATLGVTAVLVGLGVCATLAVAGGELVGRLVGEGE